MLRLHSHGFTLAELLVSLSILGVIATFTIPKILAAQQSSSNNAKAHEVAGMISAAYQQAQLAGVINANSKPGDLSPYMNYISVDTSSTIDETPALSSIACSGTNPCLKLHNGGYLWLGNLNPFNGTNSLNFIDFKFDPDPSQNTASTADGPLKAVQFSLYYNGQLTTRGQLKPSSCQAGFCANGPGPFDPSWFSW